MHDFLGCDVLKLKVPIALIKFIFDHEGAYIYKAGLELPTTPYFPIFFLNYFNILGGY